MSASNRTETLGLNNWLGSDKPERADFNADNGIIDSAMAQHFADACHITAAEREKWDSPYYFGVYFGDASLTRNIETDCPFTPNWGIIFRGESAPALTDFANGRNHNQFAIVSKRSSMSGVSISGTTLTVRQSSSPLVSNEYSAMNSSGGLYCYILFR